MRPEKHLTYYLTGVTAAPPVRLAEILPILAGGPIATRECFAGPDGAAGLILATDGEGVVADYEPDRQTWTEIPATLHAHHDGAVYLGLPKDPTERPGPAELLRNRNETVDGYPVTLGDGNEWTVPLARVFPAGTRLPESLGIGPDGAVVRAILPKYIAASRDAERIFDCIRDDYGILPDDVDRPAPIEDDEAFHLAAAALAINYRIGPVEASALGLLTTNNTSTVLMAFCDMPGFLNAREADAKKNAGPAAGVETSGSGPPAC